MSQQIPSVKLLPATHDFRNFNGHRSTSSSFHSNHPPIGSPSWTILSVILFTTCVLLMTVMPFYNKTLFQIYNKPITATLIQLIGVTVFLFFYCIFAKKYELYQSKQLQIQNLSHTPLDNDDMVPTMRNNNNNSNPDSIVSIIKELYFYNNIKMKLGYLILPAFFFSGSILLTNIGIDLSSVDISTLLRATEIVWFVILTPIITQRDYPTVHAIICAFTVMIGTILLSWSVLKTHSITPQALIINIASTIFTPFQIVYLKRATNILTDPMSIERQELGIKVMASYEITFFKMFLSLIFIVPCGLIVEGFEAWRALSEDFDFECNILVVLFGVILTCSYQWNVVSLTSYVEPVLVGVGSQLKSVFTYVASVLVGGTILFICNCVNLDDDEQHDCKSSKNKYPDCPCFDNTSNQFTGKFGPMHIVGVILVLGGMIAYAYVKYKSKHVTNINCFKQCGFCVN